jgi:hypothetical protein
MNVSSFIHGGPAVPTTLSEIERTYDWVAPAHFTGAFAYATQSGFAAFSLAMGVNFWAQTQTRWLFGLDYGRTQPKALRSVLHKEHTAVRIFDGAWIIDNDGFLPRRDYHAKLCLQINPDQNRFGLVVGSGNFSSNGLRNSVEAGATLLANSIEELNPAIRPSLLRLDALWDEATPAEDLIDAYEERWLDSFARRGGQGVDYAEGIPEAVEMFWIEAGYVTKNRGPNKPGNQIDLPRGMSTYFGFGPAPDMPPRSVIGPLTLQPPLGDPVTRDLRLGNNSMEKITLPTPEEHGFDMYDGKVLVFRRVANGFVLNALELADFEAAFGSRLTSVETMASGRRYGHLRERG